MKNTIISLVAVFFLLATHFLHGQKRYNPSNFKEFVLYDLQKDLIQQTANKDKGHAYGYACKMLDEFSQKYFSNKKIQWYAPKENTRTYFSYKGVIDVSENKNQEVYIGWQNFSDGLEWNFWITTLLRKDVKNGDFFEIIEDKKLIENIKTQINYKKNDKVDVFLYEFFGFRTPQVIENIPFEDIKEKDNFYGVFYQSKLYLFDKDGKLQKQ